MHRYLALARNALQESVALRASLVIGAAGPAISLIVSFYIWRSIFRDRTEVGWFGWEQMKAYLLVGFVAALLVTSEWHIVGRVYAGHVVSDLTRPLDFQAARFAESLGMLVFETAIAVGLVSPAAILFGSIAFPRAADTAALFVISMLATIPLKFAMLYITGLMSFWTRIFNGVVFARTAVMSVLSGSLIPLDFFPDWLRFLAMALPFQGLVNTPASIYLGRVGTAHGLLLIAAQLLWALLLLAFGRWLWTRAIRMITIDGG